MAEQQLSEEQAEEMQEKIKNMSPEELKEFQKKNCIFCQIINGDVPGKKIYEDDQSLAVLDINPANPGHILLLPKEHFSIMPQIPEQLLKHLFVAAKALSNVTLRALQTSGTNIIVANGPGAGQRAQHFMIHIIPRKENDGLNFVVPQKKHREEDLTAVQKRLSEQLGAKVEEKVKPIPTEKKVVDAEVVEEKAEPEKKIAEKKPITEKAKKKTPKKKSSVKKKPKKEKEETAVDLDSIAELLSK